MNLEELEAARVAARLKTCLRATLNQTIDLVLLFNDPEYAIRRLNEIEQATTDEKLLDLVADVRARLLPQTVEPDEPKYDYRPHGRRG
ncbi:hypothetical protein [Cognatazoarcus halotolerans]|uniref:hypothetical protein n=1 Tax=Cognatazoarcus halotolerans TaxID=2686016 RepID=UPI0013578FC2|nr:hypothetical protein [Cognatazoarcus halotolerans]